MLSCVSLGLLGEYAKSLFANTFWIFSENASFFQRILHRRLNTSRVFSDMQKE